MNWFNPGRWALYILFAGSLWLGYHAWVDHQREIGREEIRQQYAKQAEDTDDKRAAITPPIEAQHTKVVTQIRTVYKTITKEVPVYVPSDSCILPSGFRVLHDAAANGEVPDPSRIPDAATVPAQDAAATIAENYGACREIVQRLTDLQFWTRQQINLN